MEQVRQEVMDSRQTAAGVSQNERDALGLLTQMVAGILHEVNSPLCALGPGASAIYKTLETTHGLLAGQQQEVPDRTLRGLEAGLTAARAMETASRRIHSLLKDLQQLVGADEEQPVMYDIRHGLVSALASQRSGLGPHITVLQEVPDEPLWLRCRPGRLNRILHCLVQNAVQAIEGCGTITLQVQRQDGWARIAITDSGRGIPLEQQESLFDSGFANKGGRVGLRMGLPLARCAVLQLGGSISISSAPGQGTRVNIALPLVDAAGAEN